MPGLCKCLYVRIVNLGVLSLLFLLQSCNSARHSVACKVGTIVGVTDEVQFDGVSYPYRKYLGIPYAKPPIGDLRYEKPVPFPAFTSPYDGTAHRTACVQDINIRSYSRSNPTSEDCLYLNVYSPGSATIALKPKPVLVFIHGGLKGNFFKDGGSKYIAGDVLSVFGDVVVVTFNYRLSIFGFFGTNDNSSARNFALWDQHQALTWVHENIAGFDGDPNNVTLIGQSAGSVCAMYQSLYPPNRGLFHRVIFDNGSPLPVADVSIQPDLGSPSSMDAVETLRCFSSSGQDTLQCMRSKSLRTTMRAGLGQFYPVVDYDFVVADPQTILFGQEGFKDIQDFFSSLDIIVGVNTLDANTHVQSFWQNKFTMWFPSNNELDSEDTAIVKRSLFERAVIHVLGEDIYGYVHSDSDIIRSTVLGRYTPLQEVEQTERKDYRELLYKFTLDTLYLVPILKTAIAHTTVAGHGKTFLYDMDLRHTLPTSGHSHYDQGVLYTLGFSQEALKARQLSIQPSQQQLETSKVVMKLWTNFAKYGHPTPDFKADTLSSWPLFQTSNRPYMKIAASVTSAVELSSDENFGEPIASFWLTLMPYLVNAESGNPKPITADKPKPLEISPSTSLPSKQDSEEEVTSHFRVAVVALAIVVASLFIALTVLSAFFLCKQRKLRQGGEVMAL